MWPFALIHQAFAARKCSLMCKAMLFVAFLLVSSPVLPISEALSSATQLFPHHCTESPSQLWGFPLCFALLPCRVSRGGTTFLQGLSSQRQGQISWGTWRGGGGPTWLQQLCPSAGTQDAPGFQVVALLQHSLGHAAQCSIQLGDFPAGGMGEALSGW